MARLVLQSIDPGGIYEPWLTLTRPVHEAYAARWGADYRCHVGRVEDVHPAWNRIVLMLEAFAHGYQKVVWLDADTLIVRADRSIFDETEDQTPLLMCRAGLQWLGHDSWNSGVLVANSSPETVTALEWIWGQRHAEPRPHHAPSLWESNWLFDYLEEYPATVGRLDQCWNWWQCPDVMPVAEAVIQAWHGMPYAQRWAWFRRTYREIYECG